VPFDVPKGWCWSTIDEVAESNIGLTYKPSDICENGVPVYRSNNIQNRRICLNELVRVSATILPKQYLQEGDLLICARNGSRNLVGKCAIIENLNEPTSFGAFMAVCRSVLNPWIFHVLNSDYFNEYLDDSNSTAINQVTQKMLLAFKIPVPPLIEQERIILQLQHWFTLIDQIEQGKVDLQTTIKQTKSKILDLAIHGKLMPQDPNDEPASELLKRINPKAEITCDNGQYGKIPDGWCLCRLGDIGEIVTGNTPTKDIAEYYGGNIPFYKPADLEEGKFIKNASDNLSVLGFEQARKIPANSILVTCIGATIGKTGLIIVEGSCNQQINAIIPNEAAYAEFIYYTCISDYMQKKIKSNASATTLPILNKGNFAKLPFPLPPYNEQHRIVAKIEELFSSLDNIQKALEV